MTSDSNTGPVGEPVWVSGELRLGDGLNQRLFQLLRAIDRSGSINRAARECGLSYKGAWEMVERANNLSPRLLVSTATGGRSGGGTTLTETGRTLLKTYLALQEEHGRFLEALNRKLAADADFISLFRRLHMQASARNQMFGSVAEIREGAVNGEVFVSLKGGDRIVATITRESIASLGVSVGKDVLVLVKAPQVMVVKDFGGYRLSARNQLAGTVARIHKGAVNSEVVIQLPGGDSIASVLTNDSLDALALRQGESATAVFKAGAVILGVAG